jgi:hypothetical protein
MKNHFTRFAAGATLCLNLSWWTATVSADPVETIPVIDFQGVPVTTAVDNLARLARLNYLVEPNLFTAADGTPRPEPALSIHWENLTAAAALTRLLAENHLFAVSNAFSTVVLVSAKPTVAHTVEAKLLGADTNAAIPLIRFSDVPLGEALKFFINSAHLPVTLDPHVSGEAPPEPPDFKPAFVPQVSVNWHDLTARQALVALCEAYHLTIGKNGETGALTVKPGN